MKLLTHNFLSSRFLKGANAGYPLQLSCTKMDTVEGEFNENFMNNMIKKMEYSALRDVAVAIGEGANLPESLPAAGEPITIELLKELYRLMFCIEIVEGELKCPDTGRVFPIKDGIPNMLCTEDEVA